MDYKELLTKYIQHVGDSESVFFLPDTREQAEENGRLFDPGPFTSEEIDELHALAMEAIRRDNHGS